MDGDRHSTDNLKTTCLSHNDDDQQHILLEPPAKKQRFENDDSPAYSQNGQDDMVTSTGTDSSYSGIPFTAQSWNGSDDENPQSVVSGDLETSCGNLFNDTDIHVDSSCSMEGDSLQEYPPELPVDQSCTLRYEIDDDIEDNDEDTGDQSGSSIGFEVIAETRYDDDTEDNDDDTGIQSASSFGFEVNAEVENDDYSECNICDNSADIDNNSHEYVYFLPEPSVSNIDLCIHGNSPKVDLEDMIISQNSENVADASVETQPTQEIEELSCEGEHLIHTNNPDDSHSKSSSSSILNTDSPGPSTTFKSNLRKITSLNRDAKNISTMLRISDIDVVYRKLKQLRNQANRTDLVTNEILENGIDSLQQSINDEDNMDEDCDIFDLVEQVRVVVDNKIPTVNLDEIFMLLEQNQSEEKAETKVQNIADILLQKYSTVDKDTGANENEETVTTSNVDISSHEEGIFEDVKLVQKEMSAANPNEIFILLEQFADKKNRVAMVINTLKGKDSSNSKSNPQLEDPMMRMLDDLNTISALLPNRERTEIYAYLEAHYHDPNRIQVVTEELLRQELDVAERAGTNAEHNNARQPDQGTQYSNQVAPTSSPEHPSYLGKLQQEVDILRNIFPDCDPDYLFSELEARVLNPQRTALLSTEMFELRNYPRLRDRLEKEQAREKVRRLRELLLNMDEFITMFPEPEKTFYDIDRPVTEQYRQHAWQQLLNDFPMLNECYIRKKLESQNNHYLPTLKVLDKVVELYRNDRAGAVRAHKRFMSTQRERDDDMPQSPDELFYREALFYRNERQILDYIQEKKDAKKERLEQARHNGELMECGCCFDEDVLFEDMLACADGHLFCSECLQRSADSNIGEAKMKFPCLTGTCDLEYSTSTLQKVLTPKSFSIMLRKKQEEEVRQADIEDLIGCPFCSFATIMTNPEDKVFKCLNPECLKESCRLCKEPNHIPLRCDEIEKETEKNMRSYIEKRMSEAMIRQCWKCKKNFFKVEGCNKMTCTCGASMCYVCREPIDGYDHFEDGNCANEDSNRLHLVEMEKAAKKAKEEYLRDHPDVQGQQLKHDPLKLIDGVRSGQAYYGTDDEDDDDDYY